MEVESKEGQKVVHLEKKERFQMLLTAAPGHTVIRVDTITVDRHGVGVEGNIRGLLFGWSDNRTGQYGFGGIETIEAMPEEVNLAVTALRREIVDSEGPSDFLPFGHY